MRKRPPKASASPVDDKPAIGIVRKAVRVLDYIDFPKVEPKFPWDRYGDACIEEVMGFIASGASLRDIARAYGISVGTVFNAVGGTPERDEQYARAQQARAHHLAAEIRDISTLSLRGLVDPAGARVALDGLKWTASKLMPKTYGDKLEVEARVAMSVSDALNGLSASPVPPIPALPKTGG